jgi:hypothetical protein
MLALLLPAVCSLARSDGAGDLPKAERTGLWRGGEQMTPECQALWKAETYLWDVREAITKATGEVYEAYLCFPETDTSSTRLRLHAWHWDLQCLMNKATHLAYCINQEALQLESEQDEE